MYKIALSVDAMCITIVTINKIKIIADPTNATLVIWDAKFYSFACNGVSFWVFNLGSLIPRVLWTPTQHTTALQDPFSIIDPALRKGSPPSSMEPFCSLRCSSSSWSSSASPSSTYRSNELMTKQSAGTLDPLESKITSPATTSQIDTLCVSPNLPLITGTFSSLVNPWRWINLLSLT